MSFSLLRLAAISSAVLVTKPTRRTALGSVRF
jgi:hypothetical protein